ncbi:MAG: BREX system ATP-binding domain-containing protein [Thermoleophilia bacterium]
MMDVALPARRAIEALRAGVPNRDAVRALGFADEGLLAAFDSRLDTLIANAEPDQGTPGLMLAAEFGGGKSHALGYLAHRALERNLAVSKVVVSKQTPLFDPATVFLSAMESLEVGNRTGGALAEIAVSRLTDSRFRQRFDEFAMWLRTCELNSRFEATVSIFENARANPSLQDRIVTFWGGGKLEVAELKRDLRACGMAGLFPLEKVVARDLSRQRFAFMARLLRAAGYDGWVILLDELELVGRYSILQRGRSYAELARLLALDADESIPGLLAVGAITPDFESAVLREKDDYNQIGFKFRARGDFESDMTAALAERTMDEIRGGITMLRPPDGSALAQTLSLLARVYEEAYGFAPSDVTVSLDQQWQMREYLRTWITKWDLNRLDPDYIVEAPVVEPLSSDYTENTMLEQVSEDDDE